MFRIEKAARKGTPALISLWGPSGSGKTYSALHLARGLVGADGKIGMIDTENRRAEFYADLVGGWFHLDLQPPFSPDRYIEALKAYEEAGGFGCVIIDSMSHVWEGEGGVLAMADAGRDQNGREYQGLKRWQAPKMAYKRMLNNLLRAPFHVIFCIRAKDKVEQKGREIVSDGSLVPIIDKRFVYEMTVDARLTKDQHVPEDIKCPEDLLDAFPRGRPISQQTGAFIAQWVGAANPFDFDTAQVQRVARDVATMGMARLTQHAQGQPEAERKALREIWPELKAIAEQADQQPGGDPETAPGNDTAGAPLSPPKEAAAPGNGTDKQPDDGWPGGNPDYGDMAPPI